MIPIQAITSGLYSITALIGIYVYLAGDFLSAYLIPLVVTQAWRVASEFLRDDDRGGGSFSSYQIMAMFAIVFGVGIALVLPASKGAVVDLGAGLSLFRSSLAILLSQAAWIMVFVYTGKSMVTVADITFHLNQVESCHDESV